MTAMTAEKQVNNGVNVEALLAVFVTTTTVHGQGRAPSLEELEMEHLIDQASQIFERRDLSIEEISVDT